MGGDVWLLVDRVPLATGSLVELETSEARHAAGPLRLREGDAVTVADGRGRVAEAMMRAVGRPRSQVELVAVREIAPPAGTSVTIALASLHGQAMDWAVQKAVEVGVGVFVPTSTERSQVRLGTARNRVRHWRRVARQAIKQCHRPWQMEVAEPAPLESVIADAGDRRGAVADFGGRRMAQLTGSPPEILVIGPEGGFGPLDRTLLDRSGWPGIRLGDHVLRAETAVVVGGSLLVEAHRTEQSRIEDQKSKTET